MPDEACTEAMNSVAALWVGQFIYFRFAAKEDSERLSDLLKVTEPKITEKGFEPRI